MTLNAEESRKRHHADHQRARRRVAGDIDQLLWSPIQQAHFLGLMEALMHGAFEVERDTQRLALCEDAMGRLALFTDEPEAVAVDFTAEQIDEAWLEYVEVAGG